jgi:peptide/nickel transport system substrate-binding protein
MAMAAIALALVTSCVAPERARDVVVLASGADLESANPLVTVHPMSRQVQRYALFVTLARYDSALHPQPYLARRWEWSADRATFTMHLEPTLRWHDGQPTTASDAAFTLTLARDPAVGYARASDLATLDSAVAVDDSTLVLRYRVPQPTVPAVLCELPIVPRHLLRDVPRADMRRAAFATAPVGNGPFRFVRRDAGARWVFERNDAFPASLGGPPRLRRVVVAVVDEATTKFAGLVSGELDAAGIAPTMAALARRDPALHVLSYPTLQSYALVFNANRVPFDDVRLRRAVDASIDRVRLVAAAVAGFGTPARGAVPPDNPLAIRGREHHDPHLADSLFDAAGWRRTASGARAKNGRALVATLYTVASGDNPAEQLVQADLAARGVRVEIHQMELGAFLAAARAPQKQFDFLITGIPGDLSLAHLAGMFASAQARGALDYAGYHTPRLDAAFTRAADARSEPARAAAWAEVQHVLDDEVPVAWLYHARGVQGLSGRLRGVTMDLRGELVTLARWFVVGS